MQEIMKTNPPLRTEESEIAVQLGILNEQSTEQLLHELTEALALTASSLMRVALIVRTLESRDVDLTDLKIGLLPYLRQIAYGQILPQVVVRYAQSPMLIRAIGSLPIPDQEILGSGGMIRLVVPTDHGVDHRMVDPLYLTRDQVSMVFAAGRIRPIEEQLVIIQDRAKPSRPIVHRSTVRADRKRNGLTVGKRFVPVEVAIQAIAELRDTPSVEDDGVPREAKIMTPLSEDEHSRLKIHSAKVGVPMADLVRRALRAAGLI